MKKIVRFILIFMIFPHGIINGQQASYLVISEIYCSGGNNSAIWSSDYVLLYNPTGSTIDLSTWSLQYASATGSSWIKYNLSKSVAANSYFLIQGSTGSNGSAIPSPDIITGLNMSGSAGKLALVNNQTTLTGSTVLPNSNIIDFIGWGSTASEYEGRTTSGAYATSNSTTTSTCRKGWDGTTAQNDYDQSYGNAYDTDNNGNNFYSRTVSSVLPVELISFTANVLNNKVTLNWSTATEVNNYGFEILRSAQNDNWKKVGFVQGNGNSNSPKKYSFSDKPTSGKEFQYRLKQIDFNGAFEYSEITTAILENVSEFKLAQNYPNPFNPITRISYTLPFRSNVKLRVYDLLAQKVAELVDGIQEVGRYEVTFDGSSLPSGAYFYKLEAGNYVEVKKLLLVK